MSFFQNTTVLARTVIVALSLLVLAACDSDNNNNNNNGNAAEMDAGMDMGGVEDTAATITATAAADGRFEILVTALQAAGLDATLDDASGTFTVFAPTDEAFQELGDDAINALLADIETLTDILLYHVIPEQAVLAETAISLAPGTVEMANGDTVALRVEDDALFINDSQVILTDIQASNGVIHVIDMVLMPPADPEPAAGTIPEVAVAAGSFTTLVTALQATGLDATLADESAMFTVFAPTDAAFAKLGDDVIAALLGDTDTLQDILLYHVIPEMAVDSTTAISLAGTSVTMANGDPAAITFMDGNLFIDGSLVEATDVAAANGVIHVIDTVMSPPEDPTTLVDVLVADGSFTTLVQAVQAAGLVDTLSDASATFTVFAPNDEAFAKLGMDTISSLLDDPDTLRDILLYHVIPDMAVDSTTALSLAGSGSMVEMANADNVTLSLSGSDLLVNSSTVIAVDVEASNGIAHVIDTVLIPPAE